MTRQEAFNIAVGGVLAQGGPSVEGIMCRYRGPNGRKCAAGHLLADADLPPGTGFGDIVIRPIDVAAMGLDADADYRFVRDLQSDHDMAATKYGDAFLTMYREKSRRTAEKYGLDASVLG